MNHLTQPRRNERDDSLSNTRENVQPLSSMPNIFGVDTELQQEELKKIFPEIIGESHGIINVMSTIRRTASTDSVVLITGESGTGKELVASAIHRLSNRAHRKFVAINCSAIPEDLLESELFGHEKGAFTGAVQKRMGLFEKAEGGSLFLDEIGELPLRLQAKLLRVLQEKQFTTVGGSTTKQANVRIIAATNIDLPQAVKKGQFRLDLYYRLHVLPIEVPSLRSRKEDVPLLIKFFLKMFERIHNSEKPITCEQGFLDTLYNYPWPGNIRELQNLLERMVVLHPNQVLCKEFLPKEYQSSTTSYNDIESENAITTAACEFIPSLQEMKKRAENLLHESFNLDTYISALENDIIIHTLRLTNNNKNKAASILGLNRTTLVERIKKRKIGLNQGD